MSCDDSGYGTLYIVATPIGNLEDLSPRARRILEAVDVVAAEDTRHTTRLLGHFGIGTPRIAVHEHNEREISERLVERLRSGESIALVSDAGTPLISDPGYRLVRDAVTAGVPVRPVPGPSAVIAALSAAGLATDRFLFEGFMPARPAARRACLEQLRREPRTVVFYESPRRVRAALADAADVLGRQRRWVLARELTKLHEQWACGTAAELMEWLDADSNRRRGEFVLLLEGAKAGAEDEDEPLEIHVDELLKGLLRELPLKTAVAVAARLSGRRKNELYTRALELSS